MNRPLKTAVLIILICLGLASSTHILSSVRKRTQDVPRTGGTLRVRSYARDFNPVFDPAANPHYFVTEQLFDGLVKFDNKFNIQPALAEFWDPPDGQNKTVFYLRKGVKFHNGRELTAEDVKFSLERLVQRHEGSNASQYFIPKVVGAQEYWDGTAREVSGFKILGKHMFAVQWKKPYAFASGLYLLGMYYCKILPKDLLLSQGRDFFHKPIGTGPFKFAYWVRSPRLDVVGVRLERNGDYFGKKPYLDALEYSPHFSEDQFEEGDVHITPPTSEGLLRLDRYNVLENSSLRFAYIVASCHIPPLDNPEFRKALALGIDRVALSKIAYTPAQSPQVALNYIPPVFPGFYPRQVRSFFDPEKAQMLVKRHLSESGRSGLTLTICFQSPRQPMYSGLARELERELKALGISVKVRHLSSEEDILNVREPYLKFLEWEMAYPDAENIMMPLFESHSGVNRLNCRYENKTLDSLLEQAEVEASNDKRKELFRRMEKILYDEVPAIPLYNLNLRISLLRNVRGVKLPALGFLFLDTANIWLED